MRSAVLFVMGLLFCIAACESPKLDINANKPLDIPVRFYTSLKDTLPEQTFRKLKLEDVLGTKFLNADGTDIRYFEYKVDTELLQTVLAESPFNPHFEFADTKCRKISVDNLEGEFKDIEAEFAHSFITDDDETEIYECIKPPLKHIIRVDKLSQKVLHRISLVP